MYTTNPLAIDSVEHFSVLSPLSTVFDHTWSHFAGLRVSFHPTRRALPAFGVFSSSLNPIGGPSLTKEFPLQVGGPLPLRTLVNRAWPGVR